MNEKTCTRCKKSKPLTREYWYVHRRDGWQGYCITCMQDVARAHYARVRRGEHQKRQASGIDYARINALATANTERDRQIVHEFRAELDAGVYDDMPSPAEIIREFQAELKAGMYDE